MFLLRLTCTRHSSSKWLHNLFPHVDSGTSLRKINVLMERTKFGFKSKKENKKKNDVEPPSGLLCRTFG